MNVQLGDWQFIKSHKIQLAATRMTHLTISNYYSFSYQQGALLVKFRSYGYKNVDFVTKSLFLVFFKKFLLLLTSISCNFLQNKSVSTEPYNYPVKLVFSVNEHFFFWGVFFFLDVSCNISKNMRFWKQDVKKCRNLILFWMRLNVKPSVYHKGFVGNFTSSLCLLATKIY